MQNIFKDKDKKKEDSVINKFITKLSQLLEILKVIVEA